MWVLNSATNAVIGGVPCPYGVFELPFHGTINVLTEGISTNAVVGSGDVLSVYPAGVQVVEGYDIGLVMAWGVVFFITVFGVAVVARVLAKRATSWLPTKAEL